MPTIPLLSRASSVTGGDLVPVFIGSQSDVRAASLTTMLEYFDANSTVVQAAQTSADAAAAAAALAIEFAGFRFDTISEMALGDVYVDGDFILVWQAYNNTLEIFQYSAASTAAADGALIVTATGMGVGRLISTRTEYRTWSELNADVRVLPAGTYLSVFDIPGKFLTVSTGQTITFSGGIKATIVGDEFFEHFGAVGDYDGVSLGTDDTVAITAAFAANISSIRGMDGKKYLSDPISTVNASITSILCDGLCELYTRCDALNDIGVDISGRQFLELDGIHFHSTGTTADGLATVGVKINPSSVLKVGSRFRAIGYSNKGLQILQCVHAEIDRPVINSGADQGIGISLEKNGGVPCTTIIIRHPYIFGGTNGIRSDGTILLTLEEPIFELGGSSTTADGAMHLIATTALIHSPYWENCPRNMVLDDSLVTILGPIYGEATGTAPDSITYTGVAGASRGVAALENNLLSIRGIGPDTRAGLDLTIGENLIAPVSGGPVRVGKNTMEQFSGTAVESTWTTVYTHFPATGADVRARTTYRVNLRTGTTGAAAQCVDFMLNNDVISMTDGSAVPAWLRQTGNAIQVNIPPDATEANELLYEGQVEIIHGTLSFYNL